MRKILLNPLFIHSCIYSVLRGFSFAQHNLTRYAERDLRTYYEIFNSFHVPRADVIGEICARDGDDIRVFVYSYFGGGR